MNKSFDQLAADFAALFNSGADVASAAFHALLSQLLQALKTTRFFPDITEFSGDNGINTIQTVNLEINSRITVTINGMSLNYILKDGELETSGAIIIRPNDYEKDTNHKYWLMDGICMVTFTDADLDAYKLRITHNFGIKLVNAVVYDPSAKTYLKRVFTEPTSNEFALLLENENYCELVFNEALSGTYIAIIRL
jgi:hypothetical protein